MHVRRTDVIVHLCYLYHTRGHTVMLGYNYAIIIHIILQACQGLVMFTFKFHMNYKIVQHAAVYMFRL